MYPVFLELQGKKCIVVGAGTVAQRRIATLIEAGAVVTVIAPEPMPKALQTQNLTYLEQAYAPERLAGGLLVFAATNDVAQNERIVQDAQERGIWASSVTMLKNGQPDFCVPSQRHTEKMTVAIATNGTSPALASAVCQEMADTLKRYDKLCEVQEVIRQQWKQTMPDEKKRHTALRQLSAPELLTCYREQGVSAYLEHVKKIGDFTLAMPRKIAVLVVSFGTSYANTREKTIGAVERAIQSAFPEADVYRAFTSGMILRKMRKNGIATDNTEEALERLRQMGYTEVYCQPTHIIGGEEYDKLCASVAKYTGCFSVLKIGRPLLDKTADFPALLDALEPTLQKSNKTAYVFMGHGTTHSANMAYPALDNWLKRRGYENAFVGTVEGYPTLDTVLEQLAEMAYTEVVLQPLMVVAGDHAQNDMAGADEDSWKSVLTHRGYAVQVRLMGLGENTAVQNLYVRHLQEIMGE